jgi:hypothetical protein
MDISSFQSHGRPLEQTIGVDRSATISIAKSFCGFWMSSLLARVIRQIGRFSPDISFVEDRDLHFRLSLVTSIAYVNRQLIVIDENPSPSGFDVSALGQSGGAVSAAATHVGEMAGDGCTTAGCARDG